MTSRNPRVGASRSGVGSTFCRLALGVVVVAAGCEPLAGERPVAQGWSRDCRAADALRFADLAEPADYAATLLVQGDDGASEPRTRIETAVFGSPCSGATDRVACLDELEATIPSSTGWGYCGEGCTDHGFVTTVGDEVHLYDSTADVLELVGEVDAFWDALLVAQTYEYTPDCGSVVQTTEGNWRFVASILVHDCPVTVERHVVEVSPAGELDTVSVRSRRSQRACY